MSTTPNDAEVTRLVRAVCGLVRSWWKVDRIRIRPAEGQLLRLRPGNLIVIGGSRYEVVRRTTVQGPEGPYVAYDCYDGSAQGRLRVRPIGSTHQPTIEWVKKGRACVLAEHTIEVLG